MNIDKEELKTILQEVRKDFREDNKKLSEDFQRQNKVLYEKFEHDVGVIGDGWKGIKEKVDATYDEVGKIKVQLTELEMRIVAIEKRITKIEKDIELIKSDIQFIKADMKKYVRQEEFSALEKRVLILEDKYKRI